MQVRRLLLFIAILMLVALVAGSLVPPPEETRDGDPTGDRPSEATGPPPRSRAGGSEPIEVEFTAPPPDGTGAGDVDARPGRGERRTVERDRRVVVTVRTPEPAQVELDGLGLLQTATPGVPAVFDLFTGEPGRHPVLYTPAGGERRRIGTLVVEPAT